MRLLAVVLIVPLLPLTAVARPPGPASPASRGDLAWRARLTSRIGAHRDQAARLEAEPTDEGLCALAGSAEQLAEMTLEDLGRANQGAPRLPRAPAGLSAGAALPDGDPYWYVDGRKLASLAPALPAAKLLAAASPFLLPEAALAPPFWQRQQSDLNACNDLGDVPRRLDALRDAWVAAPPCARRLVRARLAGGMSALQRVECLCPGTERSVPRTLAALRRSPFGEARAAARALQEASAAGTVRAGCLQDTIDYSR